MATIADRIRWILKQRDWSQRELSKRAGLSAMHINYSLKAFDTNPNASMGVETVAAIAKAAGVSELWLSSGVGETLYVRARRLASRVFLAIIHELAHLLLARAGSLHSHADVWCLALALGAPRRLLRALRATGPVTVERLVAATGLPPWAAAARLRMGALVALRAARGAA